MKKEKKKYTDGELAIAFTCGKIYESSTFPSVGQIKVLDYLKDYKLDNPIQFLKVFIFDLENKPWYNDKIS